MKPNGYSEKEKRIIADRIINKLREELSDYRKKVIKIIKNHDWEDMAYCEDVERLIKKIKEVGEQMKEEEKGGYNGN